jgi:hypothetical protein
VLLNPLAALGDRIGPGWGDVLNGGLGLVFFVLAAIGGIIAKRRMRRAQRD